MGATPMALQYGFFYFFAGLAIVCAILMVVARSVVHSAVYLIGALLATAGIYLELHAEFLFIVQVILYVGGIMVLFVFVIMLVNLDVAARQRQFSKQLWLALLLAIILGGQLILMTHIDAPIFDTNLVPQALPPNTAEVATSLFQTYMLPFEIASILLLVAMVGAVLMAKRRDA
jgi:NADH-quinone oxidoreductase subunit J